MTETAAVWLSSEETCHTREENHTIADNLSMALMELLHKAERDQNTDFLREGVRRLAPALMELEVRQQVGGRAVRADSRAHWPTQWVSGAAVGHAGRNHRLAAVPRGRDGSYFPALLEPRRRAERALIAGVQEAYVQGVSTRWGDDLVQALGLQGISKSQVSRLCEDLDAEVERFRSRPLRVRRENMMLM